MDCTQAVYFDWPYAVYDDRSIWSRMNLRELLSKYLKRKYFWYVISRCDSIIAQTNTMRKRLLAKRPHLVINVIDVGYDEIELKSSKIAAPPIKISSLIYPTLAYPHKNIEILIEVAAKLRSLDMEFNFILTFDGSEGRREREFKATVIRSGLENFFTFCGRLDRSSLIEPLKLVTE